MQATIVQTSYYFNDTLAGAINPALAAPLKLAAAKQGLSKSSFTPNPATVLADFTEAAFTGYSESTTIVWGSPLNENDGSKTTISPATLFRCTAPGTPESIYGGFVGDGVASPGTGILGSYLLPSPIAIANAGDGFSAIIGWNLGQNATDSIVTIIQ